MEGNILNFLDIITKIINNIIEFDWFHKSMFSKIIKLLFSASFYSKTLLIEPSHPRYQTNLEFVINTLLNNDYVLNFRYFEFMFKILSKKMILFL